MNHGPVVSQPFTHPTFHLVPSGWFQLFRGVVHYVHIRLTPSPTFGCSLLEECGYERAVSEGRARHTRRKTTHSRSSLHLTGPCVTTGQYEPSRLWDWGSMNLRIWSQHLTGITMPMTGSYELTGPDVTGCWRSMVLALKVRLASPGPSSSLLPPFTFHTYSSFVWCEWVEKRKGRQPWTLLDRTLRSTANG